MMSFNDLSALEQWIVSESGRVGAQPIVLAEFDHCVVFGRVKDGGIEWAPEASGLAAEFLQDLRLFGESGEVHAWRDHDGSFQHRSLFDTGDEDSEPDTHVLWGTRAVPVSGRAGWARLTETRGIDFCVPLDLRGDLAEANAPRLLVRNYVGIESSTGLARIVDSRLVGIRTGEG
jgi:CRISPR-associated protein (TIGR03984 family)